MTRAQADSTAAPPPVQADDDATALKPGVAAMQAMLAKLNLTAAQRPRVMAVLRERRRQIQALRNEGALTPQEKRAKGKEIMDATDAKLKAILTAGQYATWEKEREHIRHEQKSAGAGTNAQLSADAASTK